jgi:hypothetical protein
MRYVSFLINNSNINLSAKNKIYNNIVSLLKQIIDVYRYKSIKPIGYSLKALLALHKIHKYNKITKEKKPSFLNI